MIFSLCGDVARPGVYELPLGLPTRKVVCDVGGATPETIKAIFPGASHGIVARARLDTGPKQPHARALYESVGYRVIPDYNDNPYASFWGEREL